jgi:hypothetical protein
MKRSSHHWLEGLGLLKYQLAIVSIAALLFWLASMISS